MSLPLRAAAIGAAALGAFVVMRWGRGLMASHAVIIALAVGVLTYSLLRTVDRLRHVYGKPDDRRLPPED